MGLGGMAMLVLVHVSSRPFAMASALDLEVGAVGAAPAGTVGRLESDRCCGYDSQGDRASVTQSYEEVTRSGYGARAKTAGVAEYLG